MLNKEFTYVIIGLIIMLVMHVIENIKNEDSHTKYENISQLVGGIACFSVKVLLWPMVVVSDILNKI